MLWVCTFGRFPQTPPSHSHAPILSRSTSSLARSHTRATPATASKKINTIPVASFLDTAENVVANPLQTKNQTLKIKNLEWLSTINSQLSSPLNLSTLDCLWTLNSLPVLDPRRSASRRLFAPIGAYFETQVNPWPLTARTPFLFFDILAARNSAHKSLPPGLSGACRASINRVMC